jgi:ferritin-like metal-binding protein YciE
MTGRVQRENSMPESSAKHRSSGSGAASGALNNDLGKLFEHQLKDTYFAENAIIKALPEMVKAAKSEELKQAFKKHLKQTEEHVSRLEKVFGIIGRKAEGVPCEAIKGIIKEGDEIAQQFGKAAAGDAGLAAAAQAVEHYEIARYGTLKAWARELGLGDAVTLLETTEEEEIETDELLTELAATLNSNAMARQDR